MAGWRCGATSLESRRDVAFGGRMEEVELKLEIAPDAVGRLRRNPLVRSLATRRGQTLRLRTVYFDTPDLLLSHQGMALRIRHDGDRRIQTLKQPVLGPAGLQANREI